MLSVSGSTVSGHSKHDTRIPECLLILKFEPLTKIPTQLQSRSSTSLQPYEIRTSSLKLKTPFAEGRRDAERCGPEGSFRTCLACDQGT